MFNKGKIIWLYGRPCSGKTTIGHALIKRLEALGLPHFFLDADELRSTVNSDLGFTIDNRQENIRRAAELACLAARQKEAVVVCAFITPFHELRDLVKLVTEKHNVPLGMYFINTTLEECARRDVKGHYKLAQEGRLDSFTGISSAFEEPSKATLIVNTLELSTDECVNKILADGLS